MRPAAVVVSDWKRFVLLVGFTNPKRCRTLLFSWLGDPVELCDK
jgi:hypothetical protein